MRAPAMLDGARVLRTAELSETLRTGKTRHVMGDEVRTDFAFLAIAKYGQEDGIYLFYCDEEWNVVTDTWHENFEDALHQATIEYVGVTFVERID